MTIASALTALNQDIQDARTVITSKGGTVTVDGGSSQLAADIATIQTGGTIDTLTITPTTSQQTITASGGVDGYSPITVNAVTSSIDANITAGNIKSGVSILGVSGSVMELNGETRTEQLASTSGATYTPSTGYNAITSITVTPKNYARTVAAGTTQSVWAVPSGYSGHGNITVSAVTAAIDANITAGNIKDGVTILGVTGNYTGTSPTGTINITSNGTVDVTNYASANVNVNKYNVTINNCLGGVDSNGAYQQPGGSVDVVFTGVKKIGTNSLMGKTMQYLFYNNPSIRSVSFPDLEEVVVAQACYYMCYGSSVTSVSAPNLKTISSLISGFAYAFGGCHLHSIDFSSLETITGQNAFSYAFEGKMFRDNYLQTATFPALSNVSGSGCFQYAFRYQTALTSLSFPALISTGFGSYTNQFNSMLQNVTGCTVHFPSNLQSVIGSWTDVTNGFGGTNTTVLFDLTATS